MSKSKVICRRCLYYVDGGGCRRTQQQKCPYDDLAKNMSLNLREKRRQLQLSLNVFQQVKLDAFQKETR
jgi:hypothetical protein